MEEGYFIPFPEWKGVGASQDLINTTIVSQLCGYIPVSVKPPKQPCVVYIDTQWYHSGNQKIPVI